MGNTRKSRRERRRRNNNLSNINKANTFEHLLPCNYQLSMSQILTGK